MLLVEFLVCSIHLILNVSLYTDPPEIGVEHSLVSSEGFADPVLICSVHANPPVFVSHLERHFCIIIANHSLINNIL